MRSTATNFPASAVIAFHVFVDLLLHLPNSMLNFSNTFDVSWLASWCPIPMWLSVVFVWRMPTFIWTMVISISLLPVIHHRSGVWRWRTEIPFPLVIVGFAFALTFSIVIELVLSVASRNIITYIGYGPKVLVVLLGTFAVFKFQCIDILVKIYGLG